MNRIHPTAIVFPNVELGDNNTIGPYCIIGGPYYTGMEVHNRGKVYIGNNNLFESFVRILSPFRNTETRIGSDCHFYSHSFVGHDGILGNGIVMTSGSRLAGVVTVEDHVNFGINSCSHQRLYIGEGSMIGAGSFLRSSILPYAKVVGVPGKAIGYNEIGMKRRNVTADQVDIMRQVFVRKFNIKI